MSGKLLIITKSVALFDIINCPQWLEIGIMIKGNDFFFGCPP